MKILYLITKSEAGGAQTHVYDLCQYFRTQHEVTVVAYPGGWLEEKCEELGVTFVANEYFSNNLNPFRVWKSYRRIQHIVSNIAPDIVHCHSSVAGFIGRMAIRNRVPTIYTAHGWGFNMGVGFVQKRISILAEKIASRYTSQIICVSEFVKDLALRYHIAPSEKFDVIYNGVQLHKTGDIKNKDIDIVFIGRLAAPKRPDLLLTAISQMTSKPMVHIIGDGPLKKSLQDTIHAYHLENHVVLRGSLKHEDIFATLQQSRLCVLLSDWEGFPMTILESMSAGVPVVASNVGGIREIILDQVNGVLVEPGESPQMIANMLEKVLADSVLVHAMGNKALAHIRESYLIEYMYKKTEEIYKKIA